MSVLHALPRIIPRGEQPPDVECCLDHLEAPQPPDDDGVCGGCVESARQIVSDAARLDPAALDDTGALRRSVLEHISKLTFAQSQAVLDRHHIYFDALPEQSRDQLTRISQQARELAQSNIYEHTQQAARTHRARRDADLFARQAEHHANAGLPATPEIDFASAL